MNVAVGRLQLSVTVAPPAADAPPRPKNDARLSRAERAHRRNQQLRAIEDDRLRWETYYRFPQ
jgi:hypothetical protein